MATGNRNPCCRFFFRKQTQKKSCKRENEGGTAETSPTDYREVVVFWEVVNIWLLQYESEILLGRFEDFLIEI